MKFNKLLLTFIALLLGVMIAAPFAFSDDGSQEKAKDIMVWQLEAIKDDDYNRFIQNGNKAFKELYDEWHYDSVK